ncbi:MAG: hypothetical protein KatS3mg048_1060 [Caldilinea sp.]|nr:MAG: hypothetical protein KatS3mg048_1060 [Caldilinea sp.]
MHGLIAFLCNLRFPYDRRLHRSSFIAERFGRVDA